VQRRIVISSNVAGRDLGSVVDDIRSAVAQAVPMPAGYRVEYGGQFESQQSASRRLLVLSIGVVAALFMLLVLAFGRARDGVLVMLNLPLALIGGVAGVFLSGGVLSVASMIGFITLFGIATRNGIMLVSHVHHLMEVEGVTSFRDAVERGAHERLVPILMTAMAAGLALVPLALGGGKTGSEIQTPMAIVSLCGLATSTLLNMIVVPTMYLRYGKPVGGPFKITCSGDPFEIQRVPAEEDRALQMIRAVLHQHRHRERHIGRALPQADPVLVNAR
jgi:Cu/Ag efflux pump CusA